MPFRAPMEDTHVNARLTLLAALLGLTGVHAAAQTNPHAAALIRDAMALEPDAERGAALYREHCSDCHGEKAWGDAAKAVPSLAGQREFYLVTQLAAIAELGRIAPDMHRALQRGDLAQPQGVRDLAAYLAGEPPGRNPQHGAGRALEAGERAYTRGCAQCHGARAEGSAEEPIPALAGQHYSYLILQLRNFSAGHRGLVEPPVLDFTAGLSPDELEAIADYLSRLPPAAAGR